MSENQQETEATCPAYTLPISVVSTPSAVFSDPDNWLMMFFPIILVIVYGFRLIYSFRWIEIFFFGYPALLLYLYMNAVLHREIKISENGIYYRVASRIRVYNWDEIDAIIVQPRSAQINIWTHNRLKRIQETGISRQQRKFARKILAQEAKMRGIKFAIYKTAFA